MNMLQGRSFAWHFLQSSSQLSGLGLTWTMCQLLSSWHISSIIIVEKTKGLLLMTPYSENAEYLTCSSKAPGSVSVAEFLVFLKAVFGHLLGKLMARVWTSVKFSTCHALGCMEKVHGMSYHLGKYKGEHNPKHFFSWLLLLVMQRAKSKILMRTIEFPLFTSSRKCRKLVQSMSLAILDKEFQVTNIMSVTLVTAGGNTMWI